MIILRLAARSLWNRKGTAALTVLSVALSVLLLLGVEKVRSGARQSFANTIAGTDLIVGARTGAVQLLLYSVFRIGNATNNITWKSLEDIARRPEVAWIVPLSLGDSHRGFRVLGTTADYFDRYRFRDSRPLAFAQGQRFEDLFEAVIGADVAAALGYRVGDRIVVAHGLGSLGLSAHEDKPFTVSGVLAKTGTPVDRTVHVSLAAIEAIHVDWQSGARVPGQTVTADEVRRMDLTPKAVTAALVGVKSRLGIFALQRFVNEYREEPLTAVLPGLALVELWSVVGTAETALIAVSAMVVLTALIGMMTAILATLNERRREMAILRAVGARPAHVFGLLIAEAGVLAAAGAGLGLALLYVALVLARPVLDARFGLYLPIEPPQARDLLVVGAVIAAGLLAGAVPALRAYATSLADGIIVRT